MMTPFEDLIHALGQALGVPLHVDPHGACCLQMNEKLRIQLEPDKKEDRVILAAFVTELNPGRFRENILKEALKANTHFITNGNAGAILSFSSRHNKLSCHTFLPLRDLSTDKLLQGLTYLTEQALAWLDAIQNGQSTPQTLQTRPTLPTPFGMRP